MSETVHDPFAGPALAARLPVTGAQREIWLAVQTMPESNLAYNECGTLRLRGDLDVPVLLASLQTMVDRHEVLRATFSPDGAWMCVDASRVLDVPVIDISADPAGRLAKLEAAAVAHEFDLANGPLTEWSLLRAADDDHYLVRTAHHLVVDGWTSWLLWHELGQSYAGAALAPPTRYGDYAQIERDFVASADGAQHLDFWLKTLENPPNALHLPHDLPRPAERTFDARRLDIPIDTELVGQLRALGVANNASLVATTLAAFAALLHRLSGQDDVIIGLAAAGQSFHEQENLAGHAVNLLPLRLHPRADLPFTDLLADARSHLLDAFEHQGVSFGEIVPHLAFERDPSRPPLVPVMFNVDVRSGDVTFGDLAVDYRSLERRAEIFELFINMVDDGQSLVLECSYNSQLFSEDAIRSRVAEYETLLRAVCATPTAALGELPLLGDAARSEWTAFNATDVPDVVVSLVDAIAATVARRPDAAAITAGATTLTYQQVHDRAAAIATALAAEGAGPGQFVAVCLDRTVHLPTALLGILMTGAAYLPLDADFPPERLAYYLRDAGCSIVLADAASSDVLRDAPATVVALEAIPAAGTFTAAPAVAGQPGFIIYTSGSTGQPKGVVVRQDSVLNVLTDIAGRLGLTDGDVQLGVTTAAFDIAGCDFFMPWLYGGTLLLAQRDEVLEGQRLVQLVDTHQVRLLQCTPATWRLMLLAGWTGSPHLLGVSTGEPLPRDLAEQLLPRVAALWNLYGPTETTIWSTGCQVQDAQLASTIGVPLANTQCYVLDAHGELVPPGVTGDLWIGGAGLAVGYHDRADLTAEKFVDHPQFGRLYQTGDLARLTPGGLECLGRIDFQVKIRGHRIELGEIEYALNQHPTVAESAAMVVERTPGNQRLVAWLSVQPGELEPTMGELRESLRGFLPPYMVPQQIVVLADLPRLPNGKLDRNSLPNPFAAHQAAEVAGTPPQTCAEHALAAIWTEVLGIASISREDRFADLGGHSMLAVQAAALIDERIGVRPALRGLMMDPMWVTAAALEGAPGLIVPSPAPSVEEPIPSPGTPDESATPPPSKSGSRFGRILGR